VTPAPTTLDARALALAAASDPAPVAVERGPVARLHWRHGLDVDTALADAATCETVPREVPALLAETHAELLDPAGVRPLAQPSPVGREVLGVLRSSPRWRELCDASRAHPLVAREAVLALHGAVLGALTTAGASRETDTRQALADLEAARAARERAKRLADEARKAGDAPKAREALRAGVTAQAAEERARGALAAAEAIASRTASTLADGDAVARVADKAAKRCDDLATLTAALGTGSGVGGDRAPPDALLRMLSKDEVKRMLRMVGALRAALARGRASRHVRGREGMVGVTVGGLAHVADLTPLSVAMLSGAVGPGAAALARLDLAEDRAAVIEKGCGLSRSGHVLVVVDQSGSMRDAREEWASAVALAIILEARADGRVCGLVTYNGAVRHSGLVDSAKSLGAAIEALCRGSIGDNNEHAALVEASRLLRTMPHGGDPADVVMVTDGQWHAANTAGVDLDRTRLRGVFIGGTAPEGMGFASTHEVRAVEGAEGHEAAVTICEGVV
jgi:hypothetical protein